jgi:hypothetical protein
VFTGDDESYLDGGEPIPDFPSPTRRILEFYKSIIFSIRKLLATPSSTTITNQQETTRSFH